MGCNSLDCIAQECLLKGVFVHSWVWMQFSVDSAYFWRIEFTTFCFVAEYLRGFRTLDTSVIFF